MFKTLTVALALGAASAFTPQQTKAVASKTALNVYGAPLTVEVVKEAEKVPAGMSESEYKSKLAMDQAKKKENRDRFKTVNFLGIEGWLKNMEAKQEFAGDKCKKTGHTYAKVKYTSKEQFDAEKAKKAGK